MIDMGGTPADWLATGGKPAKVCGKSMMPSFEHEDGGLVVMDIVAAQATAQGGLMLFSRWYGSACVIAGEGMVPLHHHPKASWEWRPVIYRWALEGCWLAVGSQSELAWRHGLAVTMHHLYADGPSPAIAEAAEDRAEALMVECLSPFQRIEYRTTGNFRVRGAKTGNVYRVTPGAGFDLLDETDDQVLVGYCLHTEHWLPMGDQALATKFALEDADLEVEVLEGARGYPRGRERRATWQDRKASKLELEAGLV